MEDMFLRKRMTKKQWYEMMKARRSVVGLGQSLGTRTMEKTRRDDRHRAKAECRKYKHVGNL